jgi:hypothetical protein
MDEAELTADQLAKKYGGFWEGEHPKYPCADWKGLVENDETRLGYWEWVEAQIEVA